MQSSITFTHCKSAVKQSLMMETFVPPPQQFSFFVISVTLSALTCPIFQFLVQSMCNQLHYYAMQSVDHYWYCKIFNVMNYQNESLLQSVYLFDILTQFWNVRSPLIKPRVPCQRIVSSPLLVVQVSLRGWKTVSHPPLEYLHPLDSRMSVRSVAYATIMQ